MDYILHEGDLSPDLKAGAVIAVDTETLGLTPRRDRLCIVQCRMEQGPVHLVRLDRKTYDAPNLKILLSDPEILKIFHYARFDLAVIRHYLGVLAMPAYCTKIASKLARTYTDHHSLKTLLRELLDIEISKQQQSSYWGADELKEEQLAYASKDVAHLHRLRDKLQEMLVREGRDHLAQRCFDFLPTQIELDLAGWAQQNIFSHH